MKYLKLSSILFALLLAVGCGTKNVKADGDTTKTTQNPATEQQEEYPDGQTNSDVGAMSGDAIDSDGNTTGMDNNSNEEDATAGAIEETIDEADTANNSNEEDATEAVASVDSLTTIYFNFDKYEIRDDMKDYIRANAEYIKNQGIKSIILQGNTDEFGSDEYNMALGQKRAISVRDALVMQGLPKNMFSTISYGTHKPVCQERTTECYAKNRRTDIVEKK
ncbi:hypothetical protein CQA53_02690 [Helicobacter didelphidarum]|uniref:Peptidoglycan-associated lipoprotein n=1 Tax=Helicobacter didelphidarum TaxID=2040648 RepID=A0A3D8IN72_9HELI|nr:OmpA family protein [Helicobacter didelphidarum]RDU66699.1 hypothetical protein CQA53_02690 [Helicobacter didelphidarum]